MKRFVCVLLLLAPPLAAADPTRLSIDFLTREVPRWQPENHCFSCHNNGDAARALLLAGSRGFTISSEALADTLDWLRRPESWDETRGNPAFSDKKLARIQFTAALAEAVRDGVPARAELLRAAQSLASLQDADGAWNVDTGGMVGAPATYGKTLATSISTRALATAAASLYADRIAKANRWMSDAAPANVLDRAAILWALPDSAAKHVAPLLAAQNSDGGWGPQPHAPSEPFDTAVVLLALASAQGPAHNDAIVRGRAFLTKFQLNDGSWPETTRPAGFTSYAERISTAGWAAYALLRTDPERH
jgi:hypothetical protein